MDLTALPDHPPPLRSFRCSDLADPSPNYFPLSLTPPTPLVLALYIVLYSDRATHVQRNGALACAKWQYAINRQPLTSSLLFDPWHEKRNVGET